MPHLEFSNRPIVPVFDTTQAVILSAITASSCSGSPHWQPSGHRVEQDGVV